MRSKLFGETTVAHPEGQTQRRITDREQELVLPVGYVCHEDTERCHQTQQDTRHGGSGGSGATANATELTVIRFFGC